MAFLNFMTRQLLANRELCNLDARTFCNNLSALEIAQLEPRATVMCQTVAVLTSAAAAKTSRNCTIKRRRPPRQPQQTQQQLPRLHLHLWRIFKCHHYFVNILCYVFVM